MKFSNTDFFWPNPLATADLVTFTEEIRKWKTSFFVQCMLQDSCESALWLFHSKVLEAVDCIRNLNKQRPEAVVWRCSVEKVFLKILQNSQETPVPESRRLQACNFITKEILAKVFSCEFCKILLQNTSSGCFWTPWC